MTYPPDVESNATKPGATPDDLFQEGLGFHDGMSVTDNNLRARDTFVELCEAYYAPMIKALVGNNTDYQHNVVCADAAWDALNSYLKNPAQYKPDLSNALPLFKYLLMSARGDRKNILAHDRKHEQVGSLFVDNHDGLPEYEIDIAAIDNVEQEIIDAVSPIWDQIDQLLPDPRDRKLVRMMMDGIRESEAYAEVLEISHFSPEDQAHEVKKHKDRIKKRVQRSDIKRELLPYD